MNDQRYTERLREALRRFGSHSYRCEIVLDDYHEGPPTGCTCGYDRALLATDEPLAAA